MDFDDVLNLEEQFYSEGFKEGQEESTKKSYLEGKEYGLQVGYQKYVIIGEISQLITLVETGVFGDQNNTQVINHLNQLKDLIDSIQVDNDYGNVIAAEKALIRIRNKVRVLTNLLPTKKSVTVQTLDEIARVVTGLEEEKKAQPSIGNLNDDGMW